ncbi:MAG: PHP domain-containing protein [Ignavibacteria bacterium]|nr:PHP domain-containing protein [Ignavibacteria bacterium]
MTGKLIKVDVHLHTCLSPCAEITQSPKRVVEKAYEKGLNLIFITDHNTMANTEAAMRAAKMFDDLRVYPGMEITTSEEIHTLALFENPEDAYSVQDVINNNLPDVYYEKEKAEQILANEDDEVEGFYDKSLLSAVDLSLDEILELIHSNNGLAIAAHIDRPSFSIISQFGFIPDNCSFDALEISPNMNIESAKEYYKEYFSRYKFVKGSDSHSLNMIGSTYMEICGKDNSFEEFRRYLYG